jgi:hypothetical protein
MAITAVRANLQQSDLINVAQLTAQYYVLKPESATRNTQ